MQLYIVTGGSKGLGQALLNLLGSKEHVTIDVSRSSKKFSCDLSKVESIPEVLDTIFRSHKLSNFSHITLINNAGVIAPISPIGDLSIDQISINLNVNLIAPIVLCNEFIKRTSNYDGQLKILNISSSVAKNPKVSWAAYSAAKAGLVNFSSCLSKELKGRCEVYCCDPGLIDTDMQKEIRNTSHEIFPEASRFKNFKDEGLLQSPQNVAQSVLSEAGII